MNVSSPTGRRFPPATPLRLERLRLGVVLSEAARAARLSLSRASILERFPESARPMEIERLRDAVTRLATNGDPEEIAANRKES